MTPPNPHGTKPVKPTLAKAVITFPVETPSVEGTAAAVEWLRSEGVYTVFDGEKAIAIPDEPHTTLIHVVCDRVTLSKGKNPV